MLIYKKLRQNPDLAVALVFAVITSMIAPPASGDILQRINLPLLGLLLFLMCIVAGLRLSGFFAAIFQHLFQSSASGRSLGRFFIFSCYFSSMFITNDVALIIFVPLAIMVFTEARRIRLMVPTVCWQTIAANLGSMLTPIGNPQNLFIYSHYHLEPLAFLSITAPIVLISGLAIYLATYTLNDCEVSLPAQPDTALPWKNILPRSAEYSASLEEHPSPAAPVHALPAPCRTSAEFSPAGRFRAARSGSAQLPLVQRSGL